MTTKQTRIKWTLQRAAEEFGVSRETVRRGLRQCGVAPKRTHSTAEIVAALFGDLEAERIRKTRAEADLLELERQQQKGELVQMGQAVEIQDKAIGPWRTRVLELANTMAGKCNPADPEHARAQLDDWIDRTLEAVNQATKELADADHKETTSVE